MRNVCVLGLGYIGLPTAGILATNGYNVLGVDVTERVVQTVNEGNIHIEEPGLHTVVQAAIGSGNLRAALTPEAADVFIIAVPTPLNDDKTANMAYVKRAAESILPHIKKDSLVILESTSPPGTCRDLLRPIFEQTGLKAGTDFCLAHCPERVLPGKILMELIKNDRVIGGLTPACAERAGELYASFVEGEVFLTDATTAEMVKILENTYRDVNIALANEAALICEELGIDFREASHYANRHPRVNVHSAGPGVGGHCISVDPWFLVERHPDTAKLIRLARERNDGMPATVVRTTIELLSGIDKPKATALGLAYKGNVDDIRESPAIPIIEGLKAAGVSVSVYDPHVNEGPYAQTSLDHALDGSDCLLLLTDHAEYAAFDPERIAGQMRNKVLFDTRSMLDAGAWKAAGFTVRRLGCGGEA